MFLALWLASALLLTWLMTTGCAKPKKESAKVPAKTDPPPTQPKQPTPGAVSTIKTGSSAEELKSASNLKDGPDEKMTKSQLVKLAKEIGIAQSVLTIMKDEKTQASAKKSGKESPAKKSKKETTEGKSKPTQEKTKSTKKSDNASEGKKKK